MERCQTGTDRPVPGVGAERGAGSAGIFGGSLLAESFVRPFKVVLVLEASKGQPLGTEADARRGCGFIFQSEVESFVMALLFLTPGINSFLGNAQPDPPYRKSAQAGQAFAGERRTIGRCEWPAAVHKCEMLIPSRAARSVRRFSVPSSNRTDTGCRHR